MPKGPQGQKRLADVVADFQFESVDVQRLAAKLKIRQRALRAASEQQSTAGPTPSDRRSEHDIIQRVRDHYQSQKQKAEPVLQQLEAHRNETQNHLALTVFDDLSRDATNQAETEVHQTTNRIEAACNNVRTATNALAIFREKHHIDYPAQYPESRLLHAALALVLLFGESVWNGWFLRVGQVHGLLGGIGLAMFISAVNVGVSFLVGRIALPATHHRRPWVKAAGWLGFVVYVALIVFMNMVVGHYRALITLLTGREVFSVLEIIQAGFDAFRIALEISNLSNLDLQSALLIVLGRHSPDEPQFRASE